MYSETVISGAQLVEAFRKEAKDFRTLCERCGVTDLDALEKCERMMTRNLEALSFAELVRKSIECGIVGFKN